MVNVRQTETKWGIGTNILELMSGVKGTLHAALNAPALSEAGPRWGGRCVCVCVEGGGMYTKQEHGVLV